jgi:hypothetical protein
MICVEEAISLASSTSSVCARTKLQQRSSVKKARAARERWYSGTESYKNTVITFINQLMSNFE